MDLIKLKYLESVYRLKSLTAAAEEQFISQPAMSKAMNILESDLDTNLMHRTKTGIVFTENGELFMKHVYLVLAAVENAKREMLDVTDKTSNITRLGMSNNAQLWLLPLIYKNFKKSYPDIIVNYREGTQKDYIDALLKEELDLIFTVQPSEESYEGLTLIPLMSAEVKLVLPEDHPLAVRYGRFVPMYELSNSVMLSYQEGSVLRAMLENKFSELGIYVNFTNACNQSFINFGMVAEGIGFTHLICNQMTPDIQYPGLVTRSFEEPLYMEEGLIMKKGHRQNRASKQLIQFIREILAPYA